MKPQATGKPKARSNREPTPINLKVLLPFQIFVDKKGVKRIVAQTLQGSFGLLPHRLDCAAALAPGILTYETEEEGEVYLAVDQGVLVKAGIGRPGLGAQCDRRDGPRQAPRGGEARVSQLDDQEKSVRSVLAKMEGGFIRRFMEFQHE